MRRIAPLALAFLAPALALPVAAQEAAPKFTIFIPDLVIQNSTRAKKLFSELETLGKGLQEKLQAKAEEGKKLQAQIQSPSLDDAGRERLQKQLRDLEYELKKQQEDSQGDFEKAKQRVFNQFQGEVSPIIDALAKEQGLKAVIQYQAGLFAYVDESWARAFTNEVIRRYDAATPAAGETAAPRPHPAAPKGTGTTGKKP